MHQQALWHESLSDALEDIILGTGGWKRVAAEMRPTMGIEDAARWLRRCLDADKRDQLHLTDVVWLLQRGRAAGIHTGMAYLCTACDYQAPEPVEPESERERLQREVLDMGKRLEQMLGRLQETERKLRAVR